MAIRRKHALYVQVLILQVGIAAIALVAIGVAAFLHTRDTLHEQYGQRALAVARTIALLPQVHEALAEGEPGGELQTLVDGMRISSGMSYIAVADAEGVRYTHPNPERIGQHLSTDPSSALGGQSIITTESGTLGTSVRAKVPIWSGDGDIIGLVSVGVLVDEIGSQTSRALWTVLLYGAGALLLAILGSIVLARRLRRKTFGLAPAEIAALYENREAMLLGIREGMVTLDSRGGITLINDEARRLLGLQGDVVGRTLTDLVPSSHFSAVLGGRDPIEDASVVTGGRVLLVNRRPAQVRSQDIGAVVTLRDRTELETLVSELASAHGMADALRARTHEHSNRLHTIAGLLELGHYDEAIRFVTHESRFAQSMTESIIDDVGDPTLNAVLLAKAAMASENGVRLKVSRDDALVTARLSAAHDTVTVLANLIDNALEAAMASDAPKAIDVALQARADTLVVCVSDSGEGVREDLVDQIFRYGYTTKAVDELGGRGIGLSLVADVVTRCGGTVEVANDAGTTGGGAVFTVTLPNALEADPDVIEHIEHIEHIERTERTERVMVPL